MKRFRFSVIVRTSPPGDDEILDLTDRLGDAGCTDASIRGHRDGTELLFDREADSFDAAIASAVADVERSGLRVARVELERDAITV